MSSDESDTAPGVDLLWEPTLSGTLVFHRQDWDKIIPGKGAVYVLCHQQFIHPVNIFGNREI